MQAGIVKRTLCSAACAAGGTAKSSPAIKNPTPPIRSRRHVNHSFILLISLRENFLFFSLFSADSLAACNPAALSRVKPYHFRGALTSETLNNSLMTSRIPPPA